MGPERERVRRVDLRPMPHRRGAAQIRRYLREGSPAGGRGWLPRLSSDRRVQGVSQAGPHAGRSAQEDDARLLDDLGLLSEVVSAADQDAELLARGSQ